MPANLITLAHFSVSSAISLPNSAGEAGRTVPPTSTSLGRDAEAREAAARVLELDPAFTISAFIARGGQSNAKLLIEGLRKAGLPE